MTDLVLKRFSSAGAAAYRSCSTFLSRAYSRSVTSIFWYRSCRACRDVHTSAAPSLESDPDKQDTEPTLFIWLKIWECWGLSAGTKRLIRLVMLTLKGKNVKLYSKSRFEPATLWLTNIQETQTQQLHGFSVSFLKLSAFSEPFLVLAFLISAVNEQKHFLRWWRWNQNRSHQINPDTDSSVLGSELHPVWFFTMWE